MHTPRASDRFRRSQHIAEAEGRGRIVVMALGPVDAAPIALDGSALAIWNAVDLDRSVSEITETLAVEHGIAPQEIADDVLKTLAQFASHALIERVDAR